MKFLLRKIKEFINYVLGLFRKTTGVAIYEVLAITPGRMHAWVDSSVGIIKKPNSAIPAKLLEAFGNYDKKRYLQFVLNK